MSGRIDPKLQGLAAILAQRNRPPLSPLAQVIADLAKLTPTASPPAEPVNYLAELMKIPPPTNSLFRGPGSPPISNEFLRGLGYPPPRAPFGTPAVTPRPANNPVRGSLVASPKRRATFYSFHFRDVFRVNHVRKAGVFRGNDRERLQTPLDRSLWERAKNTNQKVLANIINKAMGGTTTTVVLAGFETWQREWVRYEIARSLFRGNGLLTVYIDGCECPREGLSSRGFNPLSFIALGWNHRIYEKSASGEWILFSKISARVETWPKWLPRPLKGYVMPLSAGTSAYDWIADDGRSNLIRWADAAALAAGK